MYKRICIRKCKQWFVHGVFGGNIYGKWRSYEHKLYIVPGTEQWLDSWNR